MARYTSQLRVSFLVDSRGLATGFSKASRETDKFARSSQRSSRATAALGSTLRTAAIAAGGAAAAYLSITQAKAAITTTQELALTTAGLNRNLGLATKEASRWAAVTRARGIDSKTLVMSFTSLSRAIDGVKTGSEAALRPFQTLGITQKELSATGGDFQKQVMLIADALGEAEGSATRQASAAKLLGRGYRDVLPLFYEGSKGLQEQLKWADEFGATMGKDTVDAMMRFTTAQRRGRVAVLGLQIAFAKFAAPALTDVIERLGQFAAVLNDPNLTRAAKLTRIRAEFESLSDFVTDVLTDLAPVIAQQAGELGVILAKSIGKAFIETGLLGKVAIGAFVFRSLGGIAGITAAGSAVGATLGSGINQGLLGTAKAQGKDTYQTFSRGTQAVSRTKAAVAGLGVATMTAASAMKGLGVQVGLVAAAMVMLEAGTGAFKIFSKDAKDLNGYLDQTIERGKTLQATIFDIADAVNLKQGPGALGLVGQIGDLLGLGDLKDEARLAEDLKEKLGAIGNADRGRFQSLRAVIARRVEELNLTREQRKEIEKIIAASKVGSQNAAGDAIDRMNQTIASGAFVGGDLQRAVEQQLSRINDTYSRWTPRWRYKVEETFRAQIDATRRAWSQGGQLTREGQRRIQAIIERRAQLMASGDPIGIAKGVVNGWRRAGGVNDAGIKRFLGRLSKMPPAARRQASATMVAYARELEEKGKLPDGTVKRLRSKLILRFGPELWKSIASSASRGWQSVDQSFRRGADDADGKMNKLERRTKEHAKNIRRNIASIPPPVRTAYSRLAAYANETASAFGASERVKLSFRGGGKVPGRNVVPAALSPGELVSYKGREIYVPGRPEPRDSVLMYLPVGAKVFTRDGQMRLAAGSSEAEALRKQAPHFAAGGIVGSEAPRPRLSGGARVPTATGQAGIDRARKQAQGWVGKLKPTLKSMEVLAAKYGLSMTSGYRPGDDGYHGINRARDFSNSSGPTSEMYKFASFVGNNFGKYLLELIYSPLGWSIKNGARTAPYAVGDHYDHVHVALRKGGIVQALRKGGYTKNINRIWNEHNAGSGDWGGPTLPSFVVAALAQAAGMPGKTMEQVTRGESGAHAKGTARPGATGIDPGGTKGHGLWMITSGFNEDLAAKVGGWRNMLNPVVNAWAAAQIYRRQGLGAWYGTGSVTGDGLDYTGKYDIRNALGGLSFEGALWVATDGRIGEKPKAITAVQKGAGKLLRRTDKKRDRFRSSRTGTPAAFKKLRRADALVKKARALAKQGKLTQAQKLMKQANSLVAQASGRKPTGNGGGGNAGSGGGTGSGAGTDQAGAGEASSGPGFALTGEVGQNVTDLIASAAGLSPDAQESILGSALSIAQGTEGTADDYRVLTEQQSLQERIRARAQGQLDAANKTLGKYSSKEIKAAEAKRDDALAKKKQIETQLGKKGLSEQRRKQLQADLRHQNDRLREANNILRPYGKAIESRNEAAQAVASANAELASISGDIASLAPEPGDGPDTTDSAAELATAMQELVDAIKEQNRLQSSVQATSSREALQMLSDVISGQIVGKRLPVNSTPTGVRY